MEVPEVPEDFLASQLVWGYLLTCRLEVPIVSGDILACQFVWESVGRSHGTRRLVDTPIGIGVPVVMLFVSFCSTGRLIGTPASVEVPVGMLVGRPCSTWRPIVPPVGI